MPTKYSITLFYRRQCNTCHEIVTARYDTITAWSYDHFTLTGHESYTQMVRQTVVQKGRVTSDGGWKSTFKATPAS